MQIKPYSIPYSIYSAVLLMIVAVGIKSLLAPVLPEPKESDVYSPYHLLLAADWKSHYVLEVETHELEFFAALLPDLRQIRGVTIKGEPIPGSRLLPIINRLLDQPSVSYLEIQTPVTIPQGLIQSQTLKVLKLDGAQLEEFGQLSRLLPNLEVLSWTNANLEFCPMPIYRWHSIRKLDLSGNQISSLPFSLGMYPNLRTFIVDDNPIPSLRLALKYKRITKLSAQRIQLDTALINTLPPLSEKTLLPYLHQLSLNGNQLQALPDFLRHCPNLTELDLRNNPLTGDASALCALQQLKLLRTTQTALQDLPCTTARVATTPPEDSVQ